MSAPRRQLAVPGPDDKPNATKRAEVVMKLRALGFTAADLAPLVRAGMSRKELRESLVAKLATLPKRKG